MLPCTCQVLPLAIGTVGCGGSLLHKEGIGGCWEQAKKEEEEEGDKDQEEETQRKGEKGGR